MKQKMLPDCPQCQKPLPETSRYCPHCGASVVREQEPVEIVLSSGRQLRIAKDTLNIRELQTIVESGVSWWEKQLRDTEGLVREQAATAIHELSGILNSLSKQLAQGRETVRITSRLPSVRAYGTGCPVCGRGNRVGARFCVGCGSRLPDQDRGTTMPSPPRLALKLAARSHVGQVRKNNEDTCFTGDVANAAGASIKLLLVADGMGGAQAGEQASALALRTVQHELAGRLQATMPTDHEGWLEMLRQVVGVANERIYQQAQAHASQHGMGTTLSLVLVVDYVAYIAHVGDSRIYLINARGVTDDGAALVQLTTDHTLVARLVDIGQITSEQAQLMPQRNMLYRALGAEPSVEVDTLSHGLHADDTLLLCSDGLTAHVQDGEIERLVLEHASPEPVCEQLVDLANDRGGRDNISVVVAKVEPMA